MSRDWVYFMIFTGFGFIRIASKTFLGVIEEITEENRIDTLERYRIFVKVNKLIVADIMNLLFVYQSNFLG